MQSLGRALRLVVVCLARSLAFISRSFLPGMAGLWLVAVPAVGQSPAPSGPNSDPTYQALRNLTLGSEAVSVSNLDLKRDGGTFHLHSGTVCFVAPVQGKVTGAVFVGDGNFVISAPASEMSMLKLLTKEDEFSEKFEHMVLRFTDSTYDEIKKAGGPASGGCDNGLLKDSQRVTRHILKNNLEARILEDVLRPEPGGLFVAFIHGKRYNGQELFQIDPRRGGDQVDFATYDENKSGVWASFAVSGERRGSWGRSIHIEHQVLDITVEKSAHLTGKADTTLVSRANGLRVVPFDLFPALRVQSVTSGGQALAFIQEDKNDDADFFVILPTPLPAGEKCTITTVYGGKDAILNEGGGNYFPVARENWYPTSYFGEHETYEMTFRIPKGMKIAATGNLVSSADEGSKNVTVWKSEAPQPVAGFQFGQMKEEEAKLTSPEYLVAAYANEAPPDWASHFTGGAMGNLSTVSLMKKPLAEAEVAIGLYTNYFGPTPFKRLSMTQQSACDFGQSWPELVWLPTCAFYDTTVRHQLGLDWGDRGYWKVVAPHEVAHQWWGQTVGFDSYRDQWMSEGFADFSASLFLQEVYSEKGNKEFITFWNDERDLMLERTAQGFRAIDVGPLTMGYRTSNSRTGGQIYRRLIYPKGAYVLHMIRMMMWTRGTEDQRFKDAMHDFVSTYSGRNASTEEFKAMIEKHMTREMDMQGNQRMDWFFDEYVYGTQLPTYKFDYSFDTGADSDIVLNFKVTQSKVNDDFRMLVPIYLEMADGKVKFLGRAKLAGNNSVEQKVPLKGMKTKPRRAMINYYDDVLASPN
jgi:Peptidase family M1 domain